MYRPGQIPAAVIPEVDPEERVAIVVSRFNENVTGALLEGAVATLGEHGVQEQCIRIAWTPGAFEIPLIADRLARSGDFAAVLCLGAVIQGETDHHEYINSAVAQAIMRIGLESGVPVLFGLLTCRNMDQALARAGGSVGNKGKEAALAALEMMGVLRSLP